MTSPASTAMVRAMTTTPRPDDTPAATHILINPIKAHRAEEWESFARSVIARAVASQRPEIVDRVRLLRADGQEDGETLFAFVFNGGELDDYDLEPILTAEYGERQAREHFETWQELFAREQYGWSFHDVALGT